MKKALLIFLSIICNASFAQKISSTNFVSEKDRIEIQLDKIIYENNDEIVAKVIKNNTSDVINPVLLFVSAKGNDI